MADGPSSQATAAESSASSLPEATRCLPLVPVPDGEEEPDELPEGTIECSICLQGCIHPVQLPCSHIFCFLCVKGVANHSKRCALCRSEIPPDFLLRPLLLNTDDVLQTKAFDGKYQWFYEGVRGWWQYDVRASTEIEDRYQKGERVFEMLIAGFLYIVDMENMVQYRRNTPSRRRRIKRDLVDIPDKKGVAGLSCRLRPPKRTGGDGGEREDARVRASGIAGSSGGGAGLASAAGVRTDAARATDVAQLSSIQLPMQNLALVDADGGADRNRQGSHNARAPGSRLAAVDGVERAALGVRGSSRASDAIAARQLNPGSRSSRVNREAVDGTANCQQNQDATVNRVSAQNVDLVANRQPNQGTMVNRSDLEGVDGAADSQPLSLSSRANRVNSLSGDASGNSQLNQDGRVNHVNSEGVDSAANSQPSRGSRVNRVDSDGHENSQQSSLGSRNNRVNSHGVDTTANRQGIRVNNRVNSQRVEITTIDQVDNHAIANQVNQPVVNAVQNCVNTAADRSATLGRVGEVDEARLPGEQGTSATVRRIEGNAPTDQTDHVDGSSDSD